MKFLRGFPLHPFLLGSYPVLALLAHNVGQVRPNEAFRALVVSLVGTIACLLIMRLFLKDWRKAALGCALLVILFFSYGHIYEIVRQIQSLESVIGRHRYLFPLWVGIFGLGMWWIVKRTYDIDSITLALNVASIATLILPIYHISLFEISHSIAQSHAERQTSEMRETELGISGVPPDIYYPILDAYTRGAVFQNINDFDNNPFLDKLTQMGFHITEKSQSNYGITGLSLASSLNMNYIQIDGDRF